MSNCQKEEMKDCSIDLKIIPTNDVIMRYRTALNRQCGGSNGGKKKSNNKIQ